MNYLDLSQTADYKLSRLVQRISYGEIMIGQNFIVKSLSEALITHRPFEVVLAPTYWTEEQFKVVVTAVTTSGAGVAVIPRCLGIADSHLEEPALSVLVLEEISCPLVQNRLLGNLFGETEKNGNQKLWATVLTSVAPAVSGGGKFFFRNESDLSETTGRWVRSTSGLFDTQEGNVPQWRKYVSGVDVVLIDARNYSDIAQRVRLNTVVPRVLPVNFELFKVDRQLANYWAPIISSDKWLWVNKIRTSLLMVAIGSILIIFGALFIAFSGLRGVSEISGTAVAVAAPHHYVETASSRVKVEIPAGWIVKRTIGKFTAVDGASGRRLLVVTNELRSDATFRSVGVSLANRVGQRGPGWVTDLQLRGHFATKEVISYREIAGSGPSVRWYVQVAPQLQISVGCQVAESYGPEVGFCVRAVETMLIS